MTNESDSDQEASERKTGKYLLMTRPDSTESFNDIFKEGSNTVNDIFVINSNTAIVIEDLLVSIQLEHLKTLQLPGCKLEKLSDNCFDKLQLVSLGLQNNSLSYLPISLFKMETLKTLKLDYNKLSHLPDEIGELKNLTTLSCDGQKLEALPRTLSNLEQLKILSFNNNMIDNIFVVAELTSLETLRCKRNKIDQLPKKLEKLQKLFSLDISYNPLKSIPHTMLDLVKRLVHFEYYSALLRPKHVIYDKRQLVAHLEVQSFLLQTSAVRNQRDANIMFVGDSLCGKHALISALSSEKGVAKEAPTQNITHFNLTNDKETIHVSGFSLSNTILNPFLKNAVMDLYVLTFDLSSFEAQQNSPHIFARYLNRLQLWLETLFELAPLKPVILVGTKADVVKNPERLWECLERLLDEGRDKHMEYYYDCDHPHCLLCNEKGSAQRVTMERSKQNKMGFVDLANIENRSTPNGHIPNAENGNGQLRMPHIIGYFEVNCIKLLPKESKNGNTSINLVKEAIVRAIRNSAVSGIPPEWLNCLERLHKRKQVSNNPIMSIQDVNTIASGLGIQDDHIPVMLQYFHDRAMLVYFPVDEILSQFIVVDPGWFIRVLDLVLTDLDESRYTAPDLIAKWQEHSLATNVSNDQPEKVTSWLGRALIKMNVCVALPSITDKPFYLVPNNLEIGYPNSDIWPDDPDSSEKQLSVEFDLANPSAGVFSELVVTLLRRGAERLEIIASPSPLIHCHGILFYSALDFGSCNLCSKICTNWRNESEEESDDDVLHKVFIQLMPHLTTMRLTCRGPRPCCVTDAVTQFLWNHLDIDGSDGTKTYSPFESDGMYILCPKCVLTKQVEPVRFPVDELNASVKAICNKWHNLGSWSRVIKGGYQTEAHPLRSLGNLPPGEHPRLAVILPPSTETSKIEWCLRSKMNFLEGFEVHFLCEYPSSWHLPDSPGFKLTPTEKGAKPHDCLVRISHLALATTQVVCGGIEMPTNMPVVSMVITNLIKMCDYLRFVDQNISDTVQWFANNRDKVLNLLTKCIANVHNPFPDLFFKAGTAMPVENIYRLPTGTTRHELGKFLRVDSSSGRFGCLRPLCIKNEIRWLCDGHYNEMKNIAG